MKKLSPKEISLKTTWSPEDETEFHDALKRTRGDSGRMNMVVRRARAISPNHPEAATQLLEGLLRDFPDLPEYTVGEATDMLAQLSVATGDPAAGAMLLRDYARAHFPAKQNYQFLVHKFLYFIADHDCREFYQDLLDLVSSVEYVPPDSSGKYQDSAKNGWVLFGGAAYCAHLLGDEATRDDYLEKARSCHIIDAWSAHAPWRLWLFQQIAVGSRKVSDVLVRPEFTLAEMRDWSESNWRSFKPVITYTKTDEREHLILAWPEFIVDLILYSAPAKASGPISYFKKKNLGTFDTMNTRALAWKDAGDVDAIDAINTSIEILDYFQADARIVVNIG